MFNNLLVVKKKWSDSTNACALCPRWYVCTYIRVSVCLAIIEFFERTRQWCIL